MIMPAVVRDRLDWALSLMGLYRRIHGRGPSFFLHSSLPTPDRSRFSIMGFEPRTVFSCKGDEISITEAGVTLKQRGDPFEAFGELCLKLRDNGGSAAIDVPECPFHGGAVGYWGYDMKDHIEQLPSLARVEPWPDGYWMFCDAWIVADHAKQELHLTGTSEGVEQLRQALARVPSSNAVSYRSTVTPLIDTASYARNVAKIRSHIEEGDVYEVNYSQRFDVEIEPHRECTGPDIFEKLVEISPSPFSALLNCGSFSVISSSPERFLQVIDGRTESRPIKGTRPRGRTFDDDERNFLDLRYSEKDRAENLMIVDLVRNDLGRVAEVGSVEVRDLFRIESYSTVFQMVSTVTARLAEGQSTIDLIRACFPPGSMTGAPKVRAMEIIEELEPIRRGIYSGALGWIGYDGNCDLSVIIRTLVMQNGRGYFQTGGAIVWDSDADREYQECLDKGEGIRKTLEELTIENHEFTIMNSQFASPPSIDRGSVE
jgi:para-aminobenzoate synthetase component 1